jgi:hypothetical protein
VSKQDRPEDPVAQLIGAACFSIMLDLDRIERELDARSDTVSWEKDPLQWIENTLAKQLFAIEREHQQKLIAIARWYREQRLAHSAKAAEG